MLKKRPGLPAATAALLLLGPAMAWPAWAAGIGSPTGGAVLGQPLNLAVPLRLEAGEALDARCITADVTVGDRRLPANAVSIVVEPTSADTARVRVLTLPIVDEPVVSVALSVGCQAAFTRRFVVLADPPVIDAPSPPAPAAVALPAAPAQDATPTAPRPVAGEAASAPARTGSTAAASRNAARAAASPERRSTAAPRPAARAAANAPAAAGPAKPAAPRAAAGRNASPAPAPLPAAQAPRLKLESPPAQILTPQEAAAMAAVEEALRAVSEAASAVQAANSAASAAEQRALGLERSLAQQRAENQTQREATAQLRERLASSEATSNWVWPLLVGLLALSALAGWLAWQLAALRREQRTGWQQAAQGNAPAEAAAGVPAPGQPTAAAPFFTAPPPPPATARLQGAPAWPPPAPVAAPLPAPNTMADGSFAVSTQPSLVDIAPAPPAQRIFPRPAEAPVPAPAPEAVTPRDLSIEELIDLEQQAEFFIVLGQDEAAIDLLVEHVRSTGGGSPLPYLKLLEIYHRRGDREAYERTRGRFNQRFNAYAAEWSAGLLQGRSLEDYADVLPRLEKAWSQPLDAMAELESLLFRKSHGEMFDLPAYREVLFLYALARDLLDREAADTGYVDLLLPLADGGDFGVTSPHPYFGLDHDSVFDRSAAEDRPTSPVDLDLSQGDRPQRIFDPLAARLPGNKL